MESNNPIKTAGALILNNLPMFDEAAILMKQEITNSIFAEIQNFVEVWARKKGWWVGSMEWIEKDDLWIAPQEWMSPIEEDDTNALFYLDREDENTDSFDVANLCECGKTRMGLCFGKSLEFNKSVWNNACKNLPEASSLNLSSLGFEGQPKTKASGDRWFLPIKLDYHELATAYENDSYEVVLEPLRQALETVYNALPIFDELWKQLPKNP